VDCRAAVFEYNIHPGDRPSCARYPWDQPRWIAARKRTRQYALFLFPARTNLTWISVVYPSHQTEFASWTGPAQYMPEFASRLALIPGPKNNIFGPR
jgi:hypothetical protein